MSAAKKIVQWRLEAHSVKEIPFTKKELRRPKDRI
jgi:hypothetical protein